MSTGSALPLRRLGLTAASGLLSMVSLLGCHGLLPQQIAGCLDDERRDYPALKLVAKRALIDVQHDALQPVSTCEDTGQPSASISVKVAGWREFREAISYFKGQGWSRLPDGAFTMVSPEGDAVARLIKTARLDDTGDYMDVQFLRG